MQVEVAHLSAQLQILPMASFAEVIPDLDGHLWILPSVPARSSSEQLVYDMVNDAGELSLRVRLPAGRSIVGFGRGGTVYLLTRDRADGFSLERTTIIGAKAPTK